MLFISFNLAVGKLLIRRFVGARQSISRALRVKAFNYTDADADAEPQQQQQQKQQQQKQQRASGCDSSHEIIPSDQQP